MTLWWPHHWKQHKDRTVPLAFFCEAAEVLGQLGLLSSGSAALACLWAAGLRGPGQALRGPA